MLSNRIFNFSPCGEYFVSKAENGILTVWETSSNDIKQEYDVETNLNTTCTALIWGTSEHIAIRNDITKEYQVLIIGTGDGKIYVYDYCTGKIIPYFADGHDASVNDFSLDSDTSRLFSCSSDKSVILWDLTSGKINQKWNTGDHEIYSMCVIDANNLLTGSTSILWWNIKEQTVIKEFSYHDTPVILLRVVNSLNVASPSYFLSAAAGESKICAWSLNKENYSINSVASFVLPNELQNMDSSKCFSKDNPLILTATTKSGALVLFQHVLNGKTKNLVPQMTLQVTSKDYSSSIPVISSKILDCAESCIIAYGPDENPVFESVNTFECPKKLILSREEPVSRKCNRLNSKMKQCNSVKDYHIVNGKTSAIDSPYNSPKRIKLRKFTDVEQQMDMEMQTENIDSNNQTSINNRISPKSSPSVKKKRMSKKQEEKYVSSDSESDDVRCPTDPLEMANFLIQGIEEEKMLLINSVLHCNDSELIRNCVRNFPLSKLKLILLELSRRIPLKNKRYSSSLRKWLKEVLSIQLPYLITCQDLTEILDRIKEYLENTRISETLLKMNMLRGLLNIQLKSLSTSSSDTDEDCPKT